MYCITQDEPCTSGQSMPVVVLPQEVKPKKAKVPEREKSPEKEGDKPTLQEGIRKAVVILAKPASKTFSHVIVYTPRYKMPDGSYNSFKSRFELISFDNIAIGYPLTDYELEKGVRKNEFGTPVKPIGVRYRDTKDYLIAYLFARVRVGAQMVLVHAISSRLNRQLELYKDDLRDPIAQEWCAQEMWRIFPRFKGTIHAVDTCEGSVDTLREIMADMLPQGYDADWKMK